MIWAWVCLEVGHEKSTVDDLHLDGHVRGIANLGAHPYCAVRRYESLEGHIFSVNVAMQYDGAMFCNIADYDNDARVSVQ